MGYYTIHVIRILNKYNTQNNLLKLCEVTEKISHHYFDISGSWMIDKNEEGYKWYSCYSDMICVSKKLPEFEIKICGKGEN